MPTRKNQKILIEHGASEIRAALLEDEQLVQLQVLPSHRREVVGNIYRGVVRAINRSLDAAFVDIGMGKDAFLNTGNLPAASTSERGRRKRMHEVLRPGDTVLVQVAREAGGGKGAALNGFISLPGRFLVLIPETKRSGVSRKLSDKERDRIRRILDKVKLPDGVGVIVRTAGENRTKQELEKDLNYLIRLWNEVGTAAKVGGGPRLLYREGSLPIRFVRDFMTPEVGEIRVSGDAAYAEIADFVKMFSPRRAGIVIRDDSPNLFKTAGVEPQVEQLFQRKVRLAGGGQIVIDHTEALVAIDVNSGRVKGKDPESTVTATNLEAAQEIARQLILRDAGGLVVVDFIDMEEARHRKEVENTIEQAFKGDKARLRFGKISGFGLLEFSRQRLRPELRRVATEICPRCAGAGVIKAPDRAATDILMDIRAALEKPDVGRVVVDVPPDEARHILNSRRIDLINIEEETGGEIEVRPRPDARKAIITEERPSKRSLAAAAGKKAEEDRPEDIILSMYSVSDMARMAAEPLEGPSPTTAPVDEAKAETVTAAPAAEDAAPAASAGETTDLSAPAAPKKKGRGRRGSGSKTKPAGESQATDAPKTEGEAKAAPQDGKDSAVEGPGAPQPKAQAKGKAASRARGKKKAGGEKTGKAKPEGKAGSQASSEGKSRESGEGSAPAKASGGPGSKGGRGRGKAQKPRVDTSATAPAPAAERPDASVGVTAQAPQDAPGAGASKLEPVSDAPKSGDSNKRGRAKKKPAGAPSGDQAAASPAPAREAGPGEGRDPRQDSEGAGRSAEAGERGAEGAARGPDSAGRSPEEGGDQTKKKSRRRRGRRGRSSQAASSQGPDAARALEGSGSAAPGARTPAKRAPGGKASGSTASGNVGPRSAAPDSIPSGNTASGNTASGNTASGDRGHGNVAPSAQGGHGRGNKPRPGSRKPRPGSPTPSFDAGQRGAQGPGLKGGDAPESAEERRRNQEARFLSLQDRFAPTGATRRPPVQPPAELKTKDGSKDSSQSAPPKADAGGAEAPPRGSSDEASRTKSRRAPSRAKAAKPGAAEGEKKSWLKRLISPKDGPEDS